MRRILFTGTFVLIATLLLAACGGAAAVQSTPNAGETTPAATSEAATLPAVTEAAPTSAASTPVVENTATVEPTGTTAAVEPTAAATSAATAAATTASTPAASMPTTAGTTFVRLTTLLKASVNAGSGKAGTVDGLLVEHPQPPVTVSDSAAGKATPTPAPTVENAVTDFTVRYVLINTAGSDAAAKPSGSGTTGQIVVVPWQAFDFASVDNGTIVLNSEMNTLASAPHFALSEIASNQPNLSQQVTDYWSGQKIAGIPATGPSSENLALIPGNFRGISISAKEGTEIGALSDFVIDAYSGQIVSAVVNGGAAFNNQEFVIPLSHLTWSGNNGMQLGGFTFNFPSDLLKNAPKLDLNNLQLNKEWFDALNQFWSSVQSQTK